MNRRNVFRSAVLAITLGGVLATAASAQIVINRFDDASEIGDWRHDFGLPASELTLSHDALDADGNATSGSMRVDIVFDVAQGGENKLAITNDEFPSETDVSGFVSLDLDFYIDPSSAQDAFGNYGFLETVIRNTDGYTWTPGPGINFAPAGQWIHMSIPIGDFGGRVDAMRAMTIQLYGSPQKKCYTDMDWDS